MQRLPSSMLGLFRSREPWSRLFVSALPAAARADAVCLATRGDAGAAAPSAPADCSAAHSSAGSGIRKLSGMSGVWSVHAAAATYTGCSSAYRQAAVPPSVGHLRFATAARQAAEQQQQHGISEVTAVKVVKYVVIGMIIVLTVRVMPYMGVGTVQSALQLLTAESPFLQKAGAQRLSALANLSESGASAAIDGDAIPKLLHLLEHSDDQGVKREVTNALLQLAKVPKGETAMLLAEAPLICMLVMDTGDLDDKTSHGLRDLMFQLEAAAGRRA